MREIKFRIWDKQNKEMLDLEDLHYEYGKMSIRTTMYNDYFDTEDMILMQYTGIKDKNGKEIYEGDIIKYYDDTYKVEFKRDRGGYFPFAQGDGCGCCQCEVVTFFNDCEILGNIYDNPELLKEKR